MCKICLERLEQKTKSISWRSISLVGIIVFSVISVFTVVFFVKFANPRSTEYKEDVQAPYVVTLNHALFTFPDKAELETTPLSLEVGSFIELTNNESVDVSYNVSWDNTTNMSDHLKQTYTLEIRYKEADLSDVKEETLAIYRFDAGESDQREKLQTKLDISRKIAKVTTNKLGRFSLMAEPKVPPLPLGYYKNVSPVAAWKTYSSKDFDFSFNYPPQWKLSQSDNGKLSLYAHGDRQREGTEFFDGITIDISVFPKENITVEEWAKNIAPFSWYSDITDRPIEKQTIGNNTFFVADGCNNTNMCANDYILEKDGDIYKISLFVIGPDRETFYTIAQEILTSFSLARKEYDTM